MQEAVLIWGEVTKFFKPSGLDSLVHFVTYKCNARCGHCFFAGELNKSGELSADEISRVIRNLGPLKGVYISGGEPFLRDDLTRIVCEYAAQCTPSVISIPTNGFDTDRILTVCGTILEKCGDLNLTIAVSLDGLFEIHDKIRGFPGGFSRAVETAKRLKDLKRKYPHLRLHIVTVIMPGNEDSLKSISEFVRKDIDPDYHWFEPIRQTGSGGSLPHASRAGLRAFLRENVVYYHKKNAGSSKNIYSSRLLNNPIIEFSLNNIGIALDNFFDGKRWPVRCVAGRRIAVLYPNGDLSACESRPSVTNIRDFDYNVMTSLKAAAFNDEVRKICSQGCSCSHGCFIPPSVRFSPLEMGRLALKTAFARH